MARRLNFGKRFSVGSTVSAQFSGDPSLSIRPTKAMVFGGRYMKKNDPKRFACIVGNGSATATKRAVAMPIYSFTEPNEMSEDAHRALAERSVHDCVLQAIELLERGLEELNDAPQVNKSHKALVSQKGIIDCVHNLRTKCIRQSEVVDL